MAQLSTHSHLLSGVSARVHRYILQSQARVLLGSVRSVNAPILETFQDRRMERTVNCRVTPVSADGVGLDYDPGAGSAKYIGLQRCGSVWSCPVCADFLARGRRQELMKMLYLMRSHWFAVMITFTVSHSSHDRLSDSLSAISGAYRDLKSGRAWKDFVAASGWSYSVRATEVTYGFENGWHPHLHVIVLFDLSLDEWDLQWLRGWLSDRWLELLPKYGFSASDERAVDVKVGDDKVAEYVSKFGRLPRSGWHMEDELARSNVKKGARDRYTPFALLDASLAGFDWASEKFLEYHFTMKGKHQLQYSRGFKKWLRENGLILKDDEQLLNEVENDGEFAFLAAIPADIWDVIVRDRLRGQVLDFVESVNGDPGIVMSYLMDLRGDK